MSYSKQNFRSGDTLYASQLNAMDDEIAVLEAEVESTKNMVGSPLTASTAAGMTDQTKIYVYTGSETGYTAGHWYYYNGTAWTDGGVYNSVAVNTDTSLTVSGQAADSKAVGDAIDDLDSDLTDVKGSLSDIQNVLGLDETSYTFVNSTALMTDYSKVYVLTTNNHIYRAQEVQGDPPNEFGIRQLNYRIYMASPSGEAQNGYVTTDYIPFTQDDIDSTITIKNAGHVRTRYDSYYYGQCRIVGYDANHTPICVAIPGGRTNDSYLGLLKVGDDLVGSFAECATAKANFVNAGNSLAYVSFCWPLETASKTTVPEADLTAITEADVTARNYGIYISTHSSTSYQFVDTGNVYIPGENALDIINDRIDEAEVTMRGLADSVTDAVNAVDNLKSLIDGYNQIDPTKINTKTTNAVTNNGDGTYTIGTTDYGTIIFDKVITLSAGRYILYGVPSGFSFLSTTTNYNTAFVRNSGSDPIIVTIESDTTCYVGYRNTARPSSSYVIAPYVIPFGLKERTAELEEQIKDFKYIKDVSVQDYANYSSKWVSGYIGSDGNISGSDIWKTTDYIRVYDDTTISYHIAQYSGSRYAAFYDTNKALISTVSATETNSSVTGTLELPDGTRYVRMSLFVPSATSPYTEQDITTTHIIPSVHTEKIEKLEQSEYRLIDDQYEQEMTDTISKVRTESNEPSVVWMWITDIHRYVASTQTFEEMIRNMKHLASKCSVDFIFDSGDTIEGNVQQARSLGQAYDAMALFRSIGIPVLYAEGNHDNNPYISSGTLTFNLKQVFGAFFTGINEATYNANENGTDYYLDFASIGVRFISLNSCNSSVGTTYGYGNSTAQWLADALNTNHYVILYAHVSPVSDHVWNNIAPSNVANIKDALTSFVQNGGKLIVMTGHSHIDAEFINPFVEITHVCQKFEKADISTSAYQAITGMIDGIKNPDRSADDHTADAWSVCVFKTLSKELSLIRFGAGIDRYIHCEPIAPTTLTTKLSGTVTWSSSDTSVATVSNGAVTGVSTGKCAIKAKDEAGNIEVWIVNVV